MLPPHDISSKCKFDKYNYESCFHDASLMHDVSLMHKFKWKKKYTYCKISRAHADLTTRHFGTATVVFDGYGAGPSIKDNTQQRREQAKSYATVNFTGETEFDGKIDEFLSVGRNRQQLITLIGEQLKKVD